MPCFSDMVLASILAPTAGGPFLPSVTRPSTTWARPSVSVDVPTPAFDFKPQALLAESGGADLEKRIMLRPAAPHGEPAILVAGPFLEERRQKVMGQEFGVQARASLARIDSHEGVLRRLRLVCLRG